MLIRIATSAALFLHLLGRNTINGNTEEDKDESQIAGAPSELQVHASYDSVQVSWSPPRDDNILIRGYQIGWGINIPDVEKAVVDSTLRQYTIHGLRPNREYVISLRAFNKIGQGFPIYETVKTFSYGKSLTEPPSAHFGDDNKMLSPPVGLLAETLSSSQIHLSWVPNEEAFNEIYTIKYGQSGTNYQFKELNTTEDEHTFDGLKSDTQYEFAVRVANSQEWSLIAVNRTFPAPPSSPPRDLTAIGPQTKKENPDTVTLTWQPPKYANGEIKEYIILYSNDLTSPEREWMMTSVQGDRLSATIHGLFSATIYHFKVQARNVKGYGPFSSVISYTTPKPIVRDFDFDHRFTIEKGEQNISLYQHIMQMFSANLTNILLGAVTVILLVLVIALVIVCSQRKISTNGNGKKTSRQGYIQGRKQSTNCPPINADDLWIQQNGGGRFAALVNNSGTAGGIVYENYDLTTTASDCGQRILLVDHQQRAFIASDSPRPHMESPIPHYQSHYDALRPHQGGPAGTLSRNYLNSALVNPNDAHFHHQQQQSQQTPTTPRNPHIVYARADRQPIAKVDFELEHPSPLMPFHDDSGSFSEISRAGIGGFDKNNCSQLSPPLPVTNTGRNERNSCDYQKLVNQNPPATSMHSFGALDKQQQPKVAHIVRPIVASHMASNSSPSAVRNAVSQLQQQQKTPPLMGQRFTAGGKVPIGRATAQPRVNIANASESPSPYSSVRVQRGSRELDGNGTTTMHLENGGRMPENGQQRKFYQNKSNGSAEELNVQEIDQMIDTLQQLQHEFTNAEA